MKKSLATLLAGAMLVGVLPTSALAAAAQIVVAPTLVYAHVYGFQGDTASVVNQDGDYVDVTVQNGQLTVTGEGSYTSEGGYISDWADPYYENDLMGLKDSQGNVVLPANFYYVSNYTANDLLFNVCPTDDGSHTIADRQGNILLDKTYDAIYFNPMGDVTKDSAIVMMSGIWYILNLATEATIPLPESYSLYEVDTLPDGSILFWMNANGGLTVLNDAGEEVLTTEQRAFSTPFNGRDYCMCTHYDDSYNSIVTIYGTDGQVLLKDTYGAQGVNENLFIARPSKDGGYALYNADGVVGDPNANYSRVEILGDVMKAYYEDNTRNLLSLDGQPLCAPVDGDVYYDGDYDFFLAWSQETGILTVMSNDGAEIATYGNTSNINFFGDGEKIFFTDNSDIDFMDMEVIVNPVTGQRSEPYWTVESLDGDSGLAQVSLFPDGGSTPLYGVVNAADQLVVPCEYDFIVLPSTTSDYVWVGKDMGDYTYHYGVAKVEAAPAPAAPTASPSSQSVLVNGQPVAIDAYAMKDANGYETNYFKLRDIASLLNGTSCQFNVGWDGAVNLTLGEAYVANGTEMSSPFTGVQPVNPVDAATNVNGVATPLDTITLTDANGNGYTYYQLRALGDVVGFSVEWTAETGIMINSK